MTKQKEYGLHGENAAVHYLQSLHYEIIVRNWRYKYWEVDIIANDSGILVFIEVKSRSSILYGQPEDFVDLKKQKNLIQAADEYIHLTGYEGEIRFDIVSVYLETHKIDLIKDAFWSN